MDVQSCEESAVLHRDLRTQPDEVVRASGSYLWLKSGRRILDATGGAAVSCIGHGDPRVQAAISRQIGEVDYCHSMSFTCRPIEDLGKFLVDSTEGLMTRAYVVSSGSEAMDAAIKLARQYFQELKPPQPRRIHFIARRESYHGNTLGALSMSGHKGRRALYEPMLSAHMSHVSPCNSYRGLREDESAQSFVARLAEELDAEFQRVSPDTVCAFVAEPVVGAALGCMPALPGYLRAMKSVCDRYGALLILDEVMCGMGRTGTLHAWQQHGVVPDIQTIGKCMGGGYVPIAGLLVGPRVIGELERGTGCFVHGQTYQAHPTACAAALEIQKIIKSDNLLDNVITQGRYLETKLRDALSLHPHVGHIRGCGLFWGVEFVEIKETKQPFSPDRHIAQAIHQEGLRQDPGLMVYPGTGSADGETGDHIIIAPPFTVTAADIDIIISILMKTLNIVFN